MDIRAIIWDMGGVILRTQNYAPRAALAASVGLTREELERLVFEGEVSQQATLGRVGVEQLWSDVCTQLKLPPEQAAHVQRGFWGGDQFDAELIDYIRALRPRYRTALLSNAWSDLRQFLEGQKNILDAFDQVIISAEVGLMKPDSRIYQLAVERLGVAPAEAVFIDDFPINVRAARQVGLHAIRFYSPAQARADLEAILLDHKA